jgi:hypothetical protein
MPVTLEDVTPSYFTIGGESTPGEKQFDEAIEALVAGQPADFELRTKLEHGAGTRVSEARYYGIALGAANMVSEWREHLDNADRLQAIRLHLRVLLSALDELNEEIR